MGGGVGKCVSSMKVEDQTSLNEIEFEFSGHLATLLAGLDRMRAKTQLTDVTLKTENRTFHVSRSNCRLDTAPNEFGLEGIWHSVV